MSPAATPEVDVVVVGAGMAGLSAAAAVRAEGRSVAVLEARDRVGGRLEGHTFSDGTVVELGGQWVGPTQDRLLALAARLDVATFPTHVAGEDLADLGHGPRRFTGDTFALGRRTLLDAGLAQKRLERMAATVPLHAPWEAPKAERWDGQTLESWLRGNLATGEGRDFYRTVATALLCVEAAELSLLHFLFYCHSGGMLDRLLNTTGGAQEQRFVGGSQLVAERLAAELDGHVRLGEPVHHLAQDEDGVTVTHASGRTRARRAILAVPPALASRIRYAPPLPALRDGLTQRVPMGAVIKCHARYATPFWREAGLSGFAISQHDAVSLVFDNSPPDARSGVLLAFVEGAHARRAGQLAPEARRTLVLAALVRLFGPRAAAVEEWVERDWAAEEWSRGCYGGHLAPGVWTQFGRALREPCGRLHWAGTETAEVWSGYIDGAISSGERAAAEVLALSG